MPASFLPNPTRFLLLDVIRFAAFGAILVFHLSYAFWGRFGIPGVPAPGIWPLEAYARVLAFSGFAVMFVSFFLFGWRGRVSRQWWLLGLFFCVWSVSAWEFKYIWDIYPFLLVAFPLIEAARRLRVPAGALTFCGGVLVSVPFWLLDGRLRLPIGLQAALWGFCSNGLQLGDWPLLPWLGLPLLAYGVGRLAWENAGDAARTSGWRFGGEGEALVWIAALLGSMPWLGNYYVTPLGDSFGCYMFRRPAGEFWAHLLWVGIAVRTAFVPRVQSFLERSPAARWISDRSVNRQFFLCYFLHYPLCLLAAWLARGAGPGIVYQAWPFWLSLAAVAMATEVAPVVFRRIFRNHEEGGGQHAQIRPA